MRPLFKNIVKSGQHLQMGCYMVQIDKAGRATVLPISNREQKEFISTILGRF
ncbi:MAG: hypothetical protein IKE94_06340 [Aeriscardovia sp.]|nr:hypothetical protein [Aeriscardovia sp.]